MPFACIFVPNFPEAASLRAEPELQTRPTAIFEGKPPLERIIAINDNAKRLGITPGMTKAQAELCSELALRPRSALQESSTHAALLDCAQSFSPCVEDAACDTVLLDLAGMESLFGSLNKISHAISDRAAALGLPANVATASNPDTALLAARGFPGITVIPAGKEAEHLGSLPTDVLFNDRIEDEEKEIRQPPARNLRPMGHPQPARTGRAAKRGAERTSRAGRPSPAETSAWRRFPHAGSGRSSVGIRRSRGTRSSHRPARTAGLPAQPPARATLRPFRFTRTIDTRIASHAGTLQSHWHRRRIRKCRHPQ